MWPVYYVQSGKLPRKTYQNLFQELAIWVSLFHCRSRFPRFPFLLNDRNEGTKWWARNLSEWIKISLHSSTKGYTDRQFNGKSKWRFHPLQESTLISKIHHLILWLNIFYHHICAQELVVVLLADGILCPKRWIELTINNAIHYAMCNWSSIKTVLQAGTNQYMLCGLLIMFCQCIVLYCIYIILQRFWR